MIYTIRHLTTYRYGSPVTFAHCTLTLLPRADAHQTVEAATLVIEPKPRVLTRHRSFFGHEVAIAQVDVPHSEFRIESRARVTVDRPTHQAIDPALCWEDVTRAATGEWSLASNAPAHFLFPSPRITLASPVTAYSGQSFPAGVSILAGGFDLMQRIRREFRYDPDATRVSTPLIEAFEKRHGVCQDFAHIMIAGLRGLGLPARYVSGYIRTIPPPGKPRLEGADATHAWVDLWCGPDLGWVGLDPTNAIPAGNDHIVLATGRDYDDVAPVGGVLLGAGDQRITVNVDVIPSSESPEPPVV